MFCIASVVIQALMLVPILWVHGWKMKTVNHDARNHWVACYTVYGNMAYANHANETIIRQIQV